MPRPHHRLAELALVRARPEAFKEGHGDGLEHYSIVFPDRGIGVLMMSNSANAESIFKEMLELTVADMYTPWEWEGYVPYDRP